MPGELIRTAEEITEEWLGAALGIDGVELVGAEAIGTGQMSTSYRVSYRDPVDGAGSVVVKLAATNDDSRGAGVGLGVYLREVSFYREMRDRIGGPLAPCHLAAYDDGEGWFTLVLGDVSDGIQGDQVAGCSPAQARVAIEALARLHAPVFGDLTLAATGWLNQPSPLTQSVLSGLLNPFFERYGERISPAHREVCERFVEVVDAWDADRRPPLGLVHGDFRLDNLLFHGDGCTVVDWQTVSCGPAVTDAAYFLGNGLTVADRREHEEELLRAYHEGLLAQGVKGFGWEQCREEYRRRMPLGLLMVIAPAMLVERTERGDDMFMVSLERYAQAMLDLDVLDLLPEPGETVNQALRPAPEDEGRHEPGPEPLWNESWYFDAISDDGTLGLYHRIGRLPNADACLLSTCIARPGEPAIMLVDASAPLPPADDDSQAITTDSARAEQRCEEPLQRFGVRVAGTAAAHADHSAPLRGEAGEPVEIELDLTWDTAGEPYQWRLATRYEIPCRVNGTVRIGGEEHAFSGVGQRDHSWGGRDWWASDWMWSALHLDDGTHTHAVGVPTHPGFGVGYLQRDGEVTELSGVTSTPEIAADGLIERDRIEMSPGGIEAEIEPLAFGAILLEAPDGRISHFPRAMCRVRTGDGREGVGWVEWNRNQR